MPDKVDARVLIIEDDRDVRTSMELYLKHHFTEVIGSDTPRDINSTLGQKEVQLVLLDMNFRKGENDGKEGLYWLSHINELRPQAAVVLMTAYGSIELAVESLKRGASDFLVKPWNNQKLLSTLLRALELNQSREKVRKLQKDNQRLQKTMPETPLLESKAPSMKALLKAVEKVAPTDANILLKGENGTGKEVLARQIHQLSQRSSEPFVSVDLGSLSESLFEAELFGYVKGAFTGAIEDKPGRMELAEGGTLFLDEIGNIPPGLQAKLLTAIQNRTVVPLGGTQKINIDCRLICASHVDLEKAVMEGQFRQDLLFRINTIELELPALRNRTEDIPALGDHFLQALNRKYQKSIGLDATAMEAMSNYNWPGNVRELRHVIERGVILAEGERIQAIDLKLPIAVEREDDDLALEDIEKRHIARVLSRFEGNISKAAKALNINRNTLYRKIERYGL